MLLIIEKLNMLKLFSLILQIAKTSTYLIKWFLKDRVKMYSSLALSLL